MGMFLGTLTLVILWEAFVKERLIKEVGLRLDEIIQNPPADAPLIGSLNDPGLRRVIRENVQDGLRGVLP